MAVATGMRISLMNDEGGGTSALFQVGWRPLEDSGKKKEVERKVK